MTSPKSGANSTEQVTQLDRVTIRFAGDSGDGMQLTGERFTSVSALFGNDLATFPDFPAEIRAPAGTPGGVSSFQVQISDHDITTAGDAPDVLVAMNPAGLRANIELLERGATIISRIPPTELPPPYRWQLHAHYQSSAEARLLDVHLA